MFLIIRLLDGANFQNTYVAQKAFHIDGAWFISSGKISCITTSVMSNGGCTLPAVCKGGGWANEIISQQYITSKKSFISLIGTLRGTPIHGSEKGLQNQAKGGM